MKMLILFEKQWSLVIAVGEGCSDPEETCSIIGSSGRLFAECLQIASQRQAVVAFELYFTAGASSWR